MLLVDDDRAQVADRGEDRRAGADHDPLAAAAQRLPGGEALALAQRRVEQGHVVAEGGAEAAERLRRQRDLRHQHDRPPAAPAHQFAQQLDVDQRLTGPGHALENEDAGPPLGGRAEQTPEHGGLGLAGDLGHGLGGGRRESGQ